MNRMSGLQNRNENGINAVLRRSLAINVLAAILFRIVLQWHIGRSSSGIYLRDRPEVSAFGNSMASLEDGVVLWNVGAGTLGTYEGSPVVASLVLWFKDELMKKTSRLGSLVCEGISMLAPSIADAFISLGLCVIGWKVGLTYEDSLLIAQSYLWNPLSIIICCLNPFPGLWTLLSLVCVLLSSLYKSSLLTGIILALMIELGGSRFWVFVPPIMSILISSLTKDFVVSDIRLEGDSKKRLAHDNAEIAPNCSSATSSDVNDATSAKEKSLSINTSATERNIGSIPSKIVAVFLRAFVMVLIAFLVTSALLFVTSVYLFATASQQEWVLQDDVSGGLEMQTLPLHAVFPRNFELIRNHFISYLSRGIQMLGFDLQAGCNDVDLFFEQQNGLSKLMCAASGKMYTEPWNNIVPNLGLQWYFFAETFPSFRIFFRYCFVAIQVALSLVISIVLLPKHPIPTVVALGLVLSILGKHPTYSDIMLWMAFLPLLIKMSPQVPGKGVLVLLLPVPLILFSGVHWLWLDANIANVNFLYGMNLIWAAFQCGILVLLVRNTFQTLVRDSTPPDTVQSKHSS